MHNLCLWGSAFALTPDTTINVKSSSFFLAIAYSDTVLVFRLQVEADSDPKVAKNDDGDDGSVHNTVQSMSC